MLKVYATKNESDSRVILFNYNGKFFPFRSCQSFQMSNLDSYEEIINQTIIDYLVREHNEVISRLAEFLELDFDPIDYYIERGN